VFEPPKQPIADRPRKVSFITASRQAVTVFRRISVLEKTLVEAEENGRRKHRCRGELKAHEGSILREMHFMPQ
jgi:hypothetical protein